MQTKKKVLHLLASGGIGGIEVLLRDYAKYSHHENLFLFVWGGGEVAEQIRQSGNEIYILSCEERTLRKLCRRIIELCREQEIDTLVVHNAAPVLRCALIAVTIAGIGVQTVTYAHSDAADIYETGRKGWRIRKFIYGCSFSWADKVVAISHSVEQSLYRTWNLPPGKIKVIYNGVDIDRFYGTAKVGHRPLRLLYVGRLTKEKGVQTIIDALAQMSCPERFHLAIVGDGPFRRALEDQVQRLKLTDMIHFYGKSSDVPQYMAEADVFLHMPQWEEGFGLTVVEAMASGLLCVCGAKGALPEILTDGETGILLQEVTGGELAKCLETLPQRYESRELREMRRNAVTAAQRFSIRRFTEELDAVLGR